MAQVHLIDYTGNGRIDSDWHAADVLMFTKATRLNMSPDLFKEIKRWPVEKKLEELDYMAKTIPSSWEFVDVTFLIEGVSRATAQQITRTRTASYAMQSQRVTNLSDVGVVNPFPEGSVEANKFDIAVGMALGAYDSLVKDGCKLENARGILPMNTKCNIVAKYNLRTLTEMLKARKSLRAQGEYNDIAMQMLESVLRIWPWAAPFFADKEEVAISILEKVAHEIGFTVGSGPGWEIAKAIDLLRKA